MTCAFECLLAAVQWHNVIAATHYSVSIGRECMHGSRLDLALDVLQ